jgi:hypothetical protein
MAQIPPMDRSQVKLTSLQQHLCDSNAFVADATPAERIQMVWPLTLEAWSLKDPKIAERRFQKHVVRIVKNDI